MGCLSLLTPTSVSFSPARTPMPHPCSYCVVSPAGERRRSQSSSSPTLMRSSTTSRPERSPSSPTPAFWYDDSLSTASNPASPQQRRAASNRTGTRARHRDRRQRPSRDDVDEVSGLQPRESLWCNGSRMFPRSARRMGSSREIVRRIEAGCTPVGAQSRELRAWAQY